jgi:hypothetical protein
MIAKVSIDENVAGNPLPPTVGKDHKEPKYMELFVLVLS